MLTVNDTAFPAPTLVPTSTVVAGSVVRVGDNYLILGSDNAWFDLTNLTGVAAPVGPVQPVTASLIITAP